MGIFLLRVFIEIHLGSLSSMLLLPDMTVIIQRFNEIWSSIKTSLKQQVKRTSVLLPFLFLVQVMYMYVYSTCLELNDVYFFYSSDVELYCLNTFFFKTVVFIHLELCNQYQPNLGQGVFW